MTTFDVSLLVIQAAFLILAGLTLWDVARHRDIYHLQVALFVAAMTLLVLVLSDAKRVFPTWLSTVSSFAAALEPFLILRLVQYIRPTPRWTQWFAALGFVLVWLMLLLIPAPRPAWVTAVGVSYFAVANGYAGIQMLRTTRRARGISAWRALLVAVGVILLAVMIVLAGVYLTFQLAQFDIILVPLGLGLLVLMALAFYLGFTPPRILDQLWQRLELFDFLNALASHSGAERAAVALNQVTKTAVRCVGAQRAFIVISSAAHNFVMDPPRSEASFDAALLRDGVLERVWRSQTAALALTPAEMGEDISRVAHALHANALAVIPVLPTKAPPRLLLVWLSHIPLFVRDDFAFLQLLGRETATALDVAALYAEQEAQEEKFRRLLESAPEAMVIADQNGSIVLVNAQTERLFGFTRAELIGQRIEMLMPEDARRIHVQHRTAYFSSPRTRLMGGGLELRARRKNGVEFLTEISLSPIETPEGILVSAAIRDITERKRVEQQIRQQNIELELRVRERTADLRQEVMERERAEAALAQQVIELSEINQDITTLNGLGSDLQACQETAEVKRAVEHHLPKLFPNASGAVGLHTATHMEWIATWGVNGSGPAPNCAPADCWALRRGEPYLVANTANAILCKHLPARPPNAYYCIPLNGQSENLGVLHLAVDKADQLSGRKQQLALTVAGQLELTLSNLRLRESLREQSIRDPLTNLYNRRYMEQVLEREIQRAARAHSSVGLVMLDLDNFKQFNDRYGHDAGDSVLRRLAHSLVSEVRHEDVVCRYGGEEFAVIMPSTAPETLRARAVELRRTLKSIEMYHLGALLPQVTVSLGLACYPQHGLTERDLLRAADGALYRAKEKGRDMIIVAGDA